MLNLTKLWSKDWDNASDARVRSVQVLDSPIDDRGRYVVEAVFKRTVSDRPDQ